LKVQIRGCHNHTVNTAAALSHRDVDPSVCNKFKQLFTDGYSPSAAYHLHQYDLQTEHGGQYYKTSGDRRYCPDKAWCYRYDTTCNLQCCITVNYFSQTVLRYMYYT